MMTEQATVDSPRSTSNGDGAGQPIGEMSLVEIAQELEQITGRIEVERVEEREARAAYQVVADRVQASITAIREYASLLVDEQHRRMSSFNGFLGRSTEADRVTAASMAEPKPNGSAKNRGRSTGRRNIAQAILAIWDLDGYDEPLTTDEIASALTDVGYHSNAAPRSLKSTINQALAKLSRDQLIHKYRADGSQIRHNDPRSRARRYMASAQSE